MFCTPFYYPTAGEGVNMHHMQKWVDGKTNAAKPGSGEFFLPETKKWFTYGPSENPWGISHQLPHEIDVLDGTRCAHIKKTVALVAVDEGADGKPVIERWQITKHKAWASTPTR